MSHADRYARAEEFMSVVKALWDSWADDAVIDDRAGGRYARADRIRPINHKGEYYQVAGPPNLPPRPPGRPGPVRARAAPPPPPLSPPPAPPHFLAPQQPAAP